MEFNFYDVIVPSFIIFLLGISLLIYFFKNFKIALLISFIKSALFFIYFSLFFYKFHFTFLDDVTYYKVANNFFLNGKSFFELIKQPSNLVFIFEHWHFVYYMYNLLSFEIFGNFYFAPVALNIILTFMISVYLYRILELLNFNRKLSFYISIFYLIHWDILSWSTLINFKDFLVQFLTIYLVYYILKIDLSFKFKYFVKIFITALLMSFLRFYIPYLILLSYILFKVYTQYKYNRVNKTFYRVLFFILMIVILLILKLFFSSELNLFLSKFSNPIVGIIRFLLTPLPFHMDKGYEFLVFSSLLNFIFFPLMVYGICIFLQINSKYKYFILLYFFIILLFYGSFIELQGPRHKIQILPFIVTFQALGFYAFLRNIYAKSYISN